MATIDGKEKDVWGRPCSCQGLNPSCFKCGGFGMLRESPVVPKFDESTQTDGLKWSKSGKSYVIEDPTKNARIVSDKIVSGISSKLKKTGKITSPKKNPIPESWLEPYYCLKCKQFLTNAQTFGHGHMDKVLYKPFLEYSASQSTPINEIKKSTKLVAIKKETKKSTKLVSKESYFCTQCNEYLKPSQLFEHSQHINKVLQNTKPRPTSVLKKG